MLQTLNLAQTNSPSHFVLLVRGGIFKDLIDSLRVTKKYALRLIIKNANDKLLFYYTLI